MVRPSYCERPRRQEFCLLQRVKVRRWQICIQAPISGFNRSREICVAHLPNLEAGRRLGVRRFQGALNLPTALAQHVGIFSCTTGQRPSGARALCQPQRKSPRNMAGSHILTLKLTSEYRPHALNQCPAAPPPQARRYLLEQQAPDGDTATVTDTLARLEVRSVPALRILRRAPWRSLSWVEFACLVFLLAEGVRWVYVSL